MIIFKNDNWEIKTVDKNIPILSTYHGYFTDKEGSFQSNMIMGEIIYFDSYGNLLPVDQWTIKTPNTKYIQTDGINHSKDIIWNVTDKGVMTEDGKTIIDFRTQRVSK